MKIKIYEDVSFEEMEAIVENFEKDKFKIIDVDVIDIIIKEEYGKSEYKRLIIKYEYQKEYLERLENAKKEEKYLLDKLKEFKNNKLSRFKTNLAWIHFDPLHKHNDREIEDYLSISKLKSLSDKKLLNFVGIGKKTLPVLLEFLKHY